MNSAFQPIPVPSDPVSMNPSTLRGNPAAKLTMIMFSDFECPFCGRFARETLPQLEASYVKTGLLALDFRHLPLPIHANALLAATAADCAAQQGKFWEMHGPLFANQKGLLEGPIEEIAAGIGLDPGTFSKCLAAGPSTQIEADRAEAKRLGLSATPVFLIGAVTGHRQVKVQKVIRGARPLSDFVSAIEGAKSALASR